LALPAVLTRHLVLAGSVLEALALRKAARTPPIV
jgi:hypothetical protein